MTSTDPHGYVLLLASGRTVSGDSISTIIDSLIDGHSEMDDSGQLVARLDALAELLTIQQAAAIADADVSQLDEDDLDLLLHDRTTQVADIAEWALEIPLYLLAQSYEPYTDTPRPAGETIVWLDAIDERTFVDSLVSAGLAELFVAPPL